MKFTTKGKYALRMMIDIARHGEQGPVTIKEVSDRQDVSVKYLEQIITPLNKAGFVESVRGAHGGYMLIVEPKDLTAGQIIRTVETSVKYTDELDTDLPEGEPAEGRVDTSAFWQGLYDRMNDYLDSITLEDLAKEV